MPECPCTGTGPQFLGHTVVCWDLYLTAIDTLDVDHL